MVTGTSPLPPTTGEGAVQRRWKKYREKGYRLITLVSKCRVKRATTCQNSSPEEYFGNPALMAQLNLPSIPNKAYFATFDTTRPIDAKQQPKPSLAEMPVDQFIASTHP